MGVAISAFNWHAGLSFGAIATKVHISGLAHAVPLLLICYLEDLNQVQPLAVVWCKISIVPRSVSAIGQNVAIL